MPNMSRQSHHRALIRFGVACLLATMTAAVPTHAAGLAEVSCAKRLERRSVRSFAAMLRCLAREKRAGSIDSACRDRSASIMVTETRGRASCDEDVSPALERIDRCTTALLAHISDDGRCAARKVKAVVKSVLRQRGGRFSPGGTERLCRAFRRAGSCAGDCLAVDASLESCWAADGSQLTLPAVAPDDQVILFGAYEGDSISSTTIAGQDEDTETARVVIEPGTTPLYVLLTSYEEIIWRFEGAVSRVRHVVLLGSGPHGVTGIAAEQVADLADTNSSELSGYFYSNGSPEAGAVRAAVEDALGRPVDIMAGSYSVGTLSLPSATLAASVPPSSVPPGFDPAVYQLGLRFNPGGVVDIDPSTVVSAAPAELYEVLPQGFGLAQLVATGALENRSGDFSFFFLGQFYIARAIPRFPSGLYGAHSVVFVLGTGVPMPAGSPGHSCVFSEETGLPVGNELICSLLSGS